MTFRIDRRKFLVRSLGWMGAAGVAAVTGAGRTLADTTAAAAEGRTGAMRTRVIPVSGEKLPVVGLGTWQTFDPAEVNDAQLDPLRSVLRVLHEQGGRVVDSSPMYGLAEQLTGRLADELAVGEDLFFATKVWTRGREAGVEQMRQSLEKLRREKIELMQVHNLLDWRTHLPTLEQWKAEGTIRYLGITHYQERAFDDLERIMREHEIDFVQLPYSVITREAEERLLPAAADTDTAVLVNRPFEGGRLFRMTNDEPVPDAVRAYADSWAQAFLKFILAHEAVTAVIPGTSNPEHMRDNAGAGYGRLPDEAERDALLRLLDARR